MKSGLETMTTVLVVLVVMVTVGAEQGFEDWTAKHGKVYQSWREREYRQGVWSKNLVKIMSHNTRYHAGEKTYTLAMNEHGDLTHHEFHNQRTCFHGDRETNSSSLGRLPKVHYQGTLFMPPISNFTIPEELDLRNVSGECFVTPVKDQGQCGSCWSFSTTGALEGQIFRKTGKLPNLSEQQLVDCSTKFGNYGCDGGLMDMAFLYTMSVKGLMSEEDYPYTGEDGDCQFKPHKAVAGAAGYMYIPEGEEDMLTLALALNGPISIAIDASVESFQFYESGVYDEPSCSTEDLDHAVLAVGYGVYKGTPYYLVKNSWGTTWGQGGYIMMSRNGENQCGIATEGVLPLVSPS